MRWLMAVLVVIAGCADAPHEAPESVPTVTDPTDYSYLDDPDDPGAHRHDYWGGRDEITVLDVEGPRRSASCSGSAGACRMEVVWGRPAEGVVVPQGTSHVNVTFTAALASTQDVDFFVLYVKTAQESQLREVARIAPGQTVQVNATNDDNDVPHNTLSLWEFRVSAGTKADGLSFQGQGSLHAVAHRGLEIPLFPSHPDLWHGQDEITLLTAAVSGEERRTGTGWSCSNGMCREYRPEDGVVVPFGASAVRVTVDYTAATPNMRLMYSPSDTWDFLPLEPEPLDDPLQDVSIIELTRAMTDSPYAKQSLWAFRADAGELAAGVGYQRGEATLTITAIR